MSDGDPLAFRGNRYRSTHALHDWHTRSAGEQALDPDFPIVDTHHHLYGAASDTHFYRLEDLRNDLESGHRVLGTVYVEAYEAGWRAGGPRSFRSVGEVETIVSASRTPIDTRRGACHVAAAIVSNVDLTLGDDVAQVLEAHLQVGEGRLRGVRYQTTHDGGVVGRYIKNAPKRDMLSDSSFRRGFACLGRFGLSFDTVVFHNQLDEVADLADAFPRTCIVLNHVGIVLGVQEYRSQRAAVLKAWEKALHALAARPNVCVKIGGMGMPAFGFGFEFAESPASSSTLAQAWQPLIDTCVDAFGPRRCMLESNFPVDGQSCCYTELWNAFKRATRHFSRDERRELFYGTACRTYRLSELEKMGDRALEAISDGPDAASAASRGT